MMIKRFDVKLNYYFIKINNKNKIYKLYAIEKKFEIIFQKFQLLFEKNKLC